MLIKQNTFVLIKRKHLHSKWQFSEICDKFTYLGSSVSFTESDISMHLAKASTAFDSLSITWKFNLSNKIKCNFFQAAVVSILLYGCTT